MISTLALVVGGIAVATALLWASCNRLEESSHWLAMHYGVPDIVRGSVLTAVSSSMPELMTAVLAILLHADFELGLAAIIGSAIYNVLVIPAASVLIQRKPLTSNRELVYREAQFYLVSVTVLLLVVCLSVILNGGPSSAPPPGTTEVYGVFTRPLAMIPLLLYGLYLYIQYEEVRDARRTRTARGQPPPPVNLFKEWSVVLLSVVFITVGVEILLRAALALGDLLETPSFLWGMTVVAAATSIPDTLISIKASQAGRQDASISNVLGSNVFDLLVAVPVAILIGGAVTVSFSQTVPMMGFLMIATIFMLAFMRRDMKLTVAEAIWMMGLYLGFGIWMTLEAFGITSVLGVSGA